VRYLSASVSSNRDELQRQMDTLAKNVSTIRSDGGDRADRLSRYVDEGLMKAEKASRQMREAVDEQLNGMHERVSDVHEGMEALRRLVDKELEEVTEDLSNRMRKVEAASVGQLDSAHKAAERLFRQADQRISAVQGDLAGRFEMYTEQFDASVNSLQLAVLGLNKDKSKLGSSIVEPSFLPKPLPKFDDLPELPPITNDVLALAALAPAPGPTGLSPPPRASLQQPEKATSTQAVGAGPSPVEIAGLVYKSVVPETVPVAPAVVDLRGAAGPPSSGGFAAGAERSPSPEELAALVHSSVLDPETAAASRIQTGWRHRSPRDRGPSGAEQTESAEIPGGGGAAEEVRALIHSEVTRRGEEEGGELRTTTAASAGELAEQEAAAAAIQSRWRDRKEAVGKEMGDE